MANEQRTTLGGKRKLTLIDTIAQSVGLMGPVFSIAFLVPLVVGLSSASGNGAGGAASLAVVIAGVGVLGLGWIIAEYTRKIQRAGSLYDYVTDGLGGRVGTAAGWLYYFGHPGAGRGHPADDRRHDSRHNSGGVQQGALSRTGCGIFFCFSW